MTRYCLPIVVTLALMQASPAFAQNVCNDVEYANTDWSAYSVIDVYTHPDLAENLTHSSGQTWTDSEVQSAVKTILNAFNDTLATGAPPLEYRGESNVSWNQTMGPGTIHISPHLGQNCPSWIAFAAADPVPAGGRIYLRRDGTGGIAGNEDCNGGFEHYSTTSRILRGTLNHELMHLFGNKHDLPCSSGTLTCAGYPLLSCSCGAASTTDVATSWDCDLHDRNILIEQHGHLNASVAWRHKESSDGTTWTTVSTPSPPPLAPLINTASSNDSLFIFVGGRRADSTTPYGRLWRLYVPAHTWDYWGTFASDVTTQNLLGPVGVAYYGSAEPASYASYMESPAESDPLRDLKLSRFTAASTRTIYSYGNDVTSNDGVEAEVDPESEWVVLVWRDDDLVVHITLYRSDLGFVATQKLTIGGADVVAAETPSIACGDPSAGTYNCLLAFAGMPIDGQGHYLKWAHFNIINTQFGPTINWGTLYQQTLTLLSAPTVSYKGPSSSNAAFLVTFELAGTNFRTYAKGVSTSATWSSGVVHSSGAEYGYPPVAGTAYGRYELLRNRRVP